MKLCHVTVLMVVAFVFNAQALTRIGIVTDTHVGRGDSFEKIEAVYRLMKSHGVKTIFNLGDIADKHRDEWYRGYVAMRERVYPEGVEEVFVYHNHDRMEFPNDDADHIAAFEAVKRKLGAKNGRYHTMKIEGFTFLVYPMKADMKRMEAEIAAAVKENPGNPVFVLDHVPPLNTSAGSWNGSHASAATSELFRKFSQVVALTGHVHGSSANEGKIWQREFTAVGFGTYAGMAKESEHYVCIMELDPRKAVIRRYALSTGEEFRPDDPWTLEFPYDPKNPRYSREARAKSTPQPAFAPGAAVKVEPDHVHLGGLVVSFPGAMNADWTESYLVQVEDAEHDHDHPRSVSRTGNGLFAWPDIRRPAEIKTTLDPALFTPGEEVSVSVAPEGFFGNRGAAIAGRGIVVADENVRWTLIFDGLPNGAKEGEFCNKRHFTLPDKVWDSPPGTLYRIVIDLEVKQTSDATSMLELATADRRQFVGKNKFEPGSWRRRFGWTVKRPKGKGPWVLNIVGGDNLVKFHSLRVMTASGR